MSLDADQRARTAAELDANLTLSGLTPEQLASRTGLSTARTEAVLRMEGAHPVDVWLVRDALETAARESGERPVPYSVLTEDARSAAAGWFGVRDHR